MKLEGKSAIITGASMGIGRGIAQLFASEGARVIIADTDKKKGAETQKEIEEAGGSCLFVKCDVSKAKDVKTMVQKALEFCRLF